MKLISLIVPVLNEEEAIPLFYDAVQDVLHDEPYDVEILFIDDGSTDRTLEIIEGLHARDPRVRGISFSRNFGKELALAGFAYAGFLVFRTLVRGVEVPGYASLMVVTLCLGGLILCSLGIVGEYLGRVFQEVKGRPQYVVRRRIGMDDRGKRQQGKNF